MSEITKTANDFIGYEYKDITVSRSLETVYADGYENFGWKLEGTSMPLQAFSSITMKFKRDRKIRNKAELTRLQRQFDSCISEIEALERSKGISASIAAYGVGIVGTACMAGAVFAFLAEMLPLCIVLAVPAFAGWILPYFLYLNILKKKTERVMPVIDGKYDETYAICEKANSLLAS